MLQEYVLFPNCMQKWKLELNSNFCDQEKIFALSAVTLLNKLTAVWHPGGSLSLSHAALPTHLHVHSCVLQCKTLIHIHRSCKADHAVLWHR